ncbi:hypothetical protein MXB_2852 [Myxobolus squamalis]|nr:hypothetical protein MXB_2852 [Myxobolus squamalis]
MPYRLLAEERPEVTRIDSESIEKISNLAENPAGQLNDKTRLNSNDIALPDFVPTIGENVIEYTIHLNPVCLPTLSNILSDGIGSFQNDSSKSCFSSNFPMMHIRKHPDLDKWEILENDSPSISAFINQNTAVTSNDLNLSEEEIESSFWNENEASELRTLDYLQDISSKYELSEKIDDEKIITTRYIH